MTAQRVLDLRLALERREIIPYFQPVVELKTGQVRGFEVLARQSDPERGVTLPLDLIRIAEGADLIGYITEALVRETAKLARSLPKHLTFAINISPAQFCRESFAKNFHSLIQREGLCAAQLKIEVTENALLDNFQLALSIGNQLKSFGMQLALDDFGTGYSSLRQLQALPFDELKIDASFVRLMSDRRDSRKIVAATIGLGHSLGLMTVAEGIETEAQAEMLFYLGCSRGQGWLFSKPLAASEVANYLAMEERREPATQSPVSGIAITIGTTLEGMPAQRLAQLQALYDGASVGLCFLDRNLRYISLNKPMAEAHGKSIESHLGRTVGEVIPEDFAEVETYLRAALRGEATHNLEVCKFDDVPLRDRKTYLVSYQPVMDEGGEVMGISVVAVDITKRKRVENALRANIDHYRDAAEMTCQVPWIADSYGNILDIGPHWEVITGLTYEDAIHGGWRRSIHKEDVERVTARWEEAMLTATPMDIECRICRRSGDCIWVRSTGAPRFGVNGEVVRWYGTMEDIDARKKAEAALRS